MDFFFEKLFGSFSFVNDLTPWLRESFFHVAAKQDRRLARGDSERTLEMDEDCSAGADCLARGNSLRDLPEWFEELSEPLVYGEASIPAAAGRREASIRISTKTQLPKDRNFEVCRRTKIARAPCRTRISNHIPRAEKFRDLTTADHKVPREECESRNIHRYVVIVPDSATQWLQTCFG